MDAEPRYLVQRMVSALVNLSWTVLIPFLFVFIIVSHVEEGQCSRWLEAGYPALRRIFSVGLPLIGSYTASLGVMKDATAGAGMGATRVVISFVDFENWARRIVLRCRQCHASVGFIWPRPAHL